MLAFSSTLKSCKASVCFRCPLWNIAESFIVEIQYFFLHNTFQTCPARHSLDFGQPSCSWCSLELIPGVLLKWYLKKDRQSVDRRVVPVVLAPLCKTLLQGYAGNPCQRAQAPPPAFPNLVMDKLGLSSKVPCCQHSPASFTDYFILATDSNWLQKKIKKERERKENNSAP